ncbi:MAG: NUDIX hydrolase [Actinomycetota bacterium]
MTADIPVCAVGAIVLEKGEVLLVRRDRAPAMGQWSLPGGRVEWGEALREACAREVHEETGIDVEIEGLAGIAERIVPDDEGTIEYHYVIIDFWARPKSRELTAGDDASEAKWVPVGELTEYELTAGLYEFLQDRGALEGRRPRVVS